MTVLSVIKEGEFDPTVEVDEWVDADLVSFLGV